MSLIDKLTNPGPNTFYDPKFRNVFEDHLSFIINNRRDAISIRTVDPNTGGRFAGDWRGLMLSLGIFPQMHWYNMRLNGYTSCSDYDGTQLEIELLDISVVEKLSASFRTIRKN